MSRKKWLLSVVFISCLCLIVVACSKEKGEFHYSFMAEYQNLPDENPPLKERLVMEKFGITTDTNYITLSDGIERFNTLFASGNYPDVIINLNHEAEVKRWGDAGYLVPISDYLDQLPEYTKRWSEEDWKIVELLATNTDGKLYYLPAQNYRSVSKTWIYRKDIFDELDLEFPKTLDELYDTLKTLKEAYPNSIPLSSRGLDDLMGGVTNALRLPGYSMSGFRGFWVDPDENNEVVYAHSQEKWRDAIKYFAKLYEEGLIEKEFPTMTSEQWTERGANNQALILWTWGTRADYFQGLMQDDKAEWVWAKNPISGEKTGFVDRELPFYAYGPVITNKVEGDRLDKILEYFNWAASDEGQRFHTLGVEGETYEVVEGKPQYVDSIKDKHDLFRQSGFFEFLFTDAEFITTDRDKQTDLEVSEALGDYPYAPFVAYRYTDEQQERANQLITGVTDIVQQFTVRAMMGQLDIHDDEVWNKYISDLNKAGLEELLEIHQQAVVMIE